MKTIFKIDEKEKFYKEVENSSEADQFILIHENRNLSGILRHLSTDFQKRKQHYFISVTPQFIYLTDCGSNCGYTGAVFFTDEELKDIIK